MIRAITFMGAMLAAAPAAAQQSGWQYKCPEAGTTVERSIGDTITYRGTDSRDPMVCLVGGGQRLALGVWGAEEALWRNGRTGIAALVGGQAAERRFDYFSVGRDSTSTHVYETWRAAGSDRVTVPAGTFDAIRLQRNFQIAGITYSYVQTVWIDRASGVPVKAMVEHTNAVMAPTLVSWEATDVRPPARRAGT